MKSITGQETLEAKRAFEGHMERMGIKVQHSNEDNGPFADNVFPGDVKEKQQGITFCGVGAHFQNGIVEKKIRNLQGAARTMLIHAENRWPKAVNTSLWPYAIRYAAIVMNSTTLNKQTESPTEKLTGSTVKPTVRHFHSFACPVYILDHRLQSSNALSKWKSRARVGINLGPSPRHARSVALVLNIETGLVSP